MMMKIFMMMKMFIVIMISLLILAMIIRCGDKSSVTSAGNDDDDINQFEL